MIYFICWAVFIGALIVSTIVVAMMGNKSSRPATEAAPVAMNEAFDEEEFVAEEMDEAVADSAEEFGEPGGDDFAEFENEFS
ncbi:hypothetical protein [Neorhodopirellula lusitana]|uniref:hypothetical protein n=1 Tax=Neorhodopirellula lusitana TaxID=445327 RepID=UPI00384CCE9A